jgi:ATP-dependent RNA helicase SUPV3L1/SUV3
MVERFSAEVRRLLREGTSILPPAQLSPLGIGAENAVTLIASLGYVSSIGEEGVAIAIKRKPQRSKKTSVKKKLAGNDGKPDKKSPKLGLSRPKEKPIDPDSPFAVLKGLVKS